MVRKRTGRTRCLRTEAALATSREHRKAPEPRAVAFSHTTPSRYASADVSGTKGAGYRPRRQHPLLGGAPLVTLGALALIGLMAAAGILTIHTPDWATLPVVVVVLVLLGWGLCKAGTP